MNNERHLTDEQISDQVKQLLDEVKHLTDKVAKIHAETLKDYGTRNDGWKESSFSLSRRSIIGDLDSARENLRQLYNTLNGLTF